MTAVALLAAFLATVLSLAVARYAAELLGIGEQAFLRWLPLVFPLSLAPGAIILWRAAVWMRRTKDGEARAAHELAQRRHEAADQQLREALRNIPDLARYAQFVGVSPFHVRSVDDARKIEGRVAELSRNPAWVHYAGRVFRGEYISDEMIAYWEHPERPLLCEHLRAIEADLRLAAPDLIPVRQGINVNRRLRIEELRCRYRLAAGIVFQEEPPNHRDQNEMQWLRCVECPCEVTGNASGPAFPPEDS